MFEDIQVGDIVFIKDYIKYGFNIEEVFWVKAMVKRVTPTQFVTDNERKFRKKDGKEIGGHYFSYAKKEGTDQIKEKELFKKKLSLIYNARKKIDNLPLNFTSSELNDLNVNKLIEINKYLDNIKNIVDETKKTN